MFREQQGWYQWGMVPKSSGGPPSISLSPVSQSSSSFAIFALGGLLLCKGSTLLVFQEESKSMNASFSWDVKNCNSLAVFVVVKVVFCHWPGNIIVSWAIASSFWNLISLYSDYLSLTGEQGLLKVTWKYVLGFIFYAFPRFEEQSEATHHCTHRCVRKCFSVKIQRCPNFWNIYYFGRKR